MINEYSVRSMQDWDGCGADLMLTDPPFGIKFDGKNKNYNRKAENVVGGYVEWDKSDYRKYMVDLLDCAYRNLNDHGQILIFSGWNNSSVVHEAINQFEKFTMQGKLYWSYNFAPACKKRPSHNIYEIYWATKDPNVWTYNKRCSTIHCQKGEPNLSTLVFKRDYKVNMPKYPTRLPMELLKCLIEHFSNSGDLIFDPLCGSGMVGLAASSIGRRFLIGDKNQEGKKVFLLLEKFYQDCEAKNENTK